jgi:ornithine carbamoyltransferase
MRRNLISLLDLSQEEIQSLIDLSFEIKQKDKRKETYSPLKGKSLALIFQKPSMRTRISCEMGMWQLGGKAFYLSQQEVGLGEREAIEDLSRGISRYFDAVVLRTYSHDTIIKFAASSTIPTINGLSDLFHPLQALSDLFTIRERFGDLKGVKIAFVGDGNNVCHSLSIAAAKMGMNLRIATPHPYSPKKEVVREVKEIAKRSGATIEFLHNPKDAAKEADIIYTDVWVSMGEEDEAEYKRREFRGYQVNSSLLQLTNKDAVVMHCLPAHRGEEISSEVLDGPHSIVFHQAENRLYTTKAVLVFLMG